MYFALPIERFSEVTTTKHKWIIINDNESLSAFHVAYLKSKIHFKLKKNYKHIYILYILRKY